MYQPGKREQEENRHAKKHMQLVYEGHIPEYIRVGLQCHYALHPAGQDHHDRRIAVHGVVDGKRYGD